LEHSGRILRRIVDDTYAIADYAMEAGAKLCDVSTSEVYGGGREGYCAEGDTMIIPPKVSARLEYAMGKLGGEIALMNLTRVTGLQATIVRPFNVSGPRQSDRGGFVVPRFVKQALAGDPLTVYADGKAVRAFTHVRDIAAGILLAMRRGRSGEAYNVGNPANKTTIRELAERVIEVTESDSRIDFVDPKELWGPLFEEANDKYPDATRAMEELGWKPRHGLDETIRETADYIREGRRD
jgi:UDP-glucose 4-epimerase